MMMLMSLYVKAQLSIVDGTSSYIIDFDQSHIGVNEDAFTGDGFTKTPLAGQLDADAWAVTGFTDGDKAFGVESTSGDYARGTDNGGVSTGGLYSFDLGNGNKSLGLQSTANDFTPGTLTLKIDNNSMSVINTLDIDYKIFVRNDQNYASTFNFSISYNNTNFSNVNSGNYTTPMNSGSTDWINNNVAIQLAGLQISPGNSFYIRWSSSDAGGNGNRDEIALDDIEITTGGAVVQCVEPSTQANNLNFDLVTSNFIQASFTQSTADKFLVVQSTNAILDGEPMDGVAYLPGDIIGNGTVIQSSQNNFINSLGLQENTNYYYFIFACNDFCNGGPDYLTSNPLTGSTITQAEMFNYYYSSIGSETCADLKTALFNLIDNHTVVSYGSLWTHYQTTDDHLNDAATEIIVWDMYSDNPVGAENEFTFVAEQCGNFQQEGDCYNREHTFPKSWWGGSTSDPQYTDIFTVVPTDGWVNGLRNNNPYGEVQSGTETHTTNNGSVIGSSSVNIPGYSGSVFEPIDDYKGDLARGYFYMATRYEDEIAGWEVSTTESDAVLDGTSDKVFEPWMLDLLMSWHDNDPVDQKEIDRNEAIFGIQGNRNPFIDHPEYVKEIWNGCSIDSCIYVYTTADSGPGSLRAAIECASANDVITFSPNLYNSSIILSTDSLEIDKNIRIETEVSNNIRIEAQSPYQSTLKTLFKIPSGNQVTLKGFTIDGAFGPHGSALTNEGVLIIENMTFTSGGNTTINSVFLNKPGAILIYQGANFIE